MNSGSFAEAVLALFTPPDRAASIVGDLSEQARGGAWFWLQVARTATAMYCQDLREAPLRISALVAFTTATFLGFRVAQLVGGIVIYVPLEWTAWQVGIFGCANVLVLLMLGIFLAHFSNGRPMTACITSTVVSQIVMTVWRCSKLWSLMEGFTLADKFFYLFHFDLPESAFFSIVGAIPIIGAGYLYRRRALRRSIVR